jgi:hypothetical protein
MFTQNTAKQNCMNNSSSCTSPDANKFVSAEQLLKVLWDDCSRPSLREQQAR